MQKRIKIIAAGIRKDMDDAFKDKNVDLTFLEVATGIQVLSILYDKFPLILKLYKNDTNYQALKSWYKNQDIKDIEKPKENIKNEEEN